LTKLLETRFEIVGTVANSKEGVYGYTPTKVIHLFQKQRRKKGGGGASATGSGSAQDYGEAAADSVKAAGRARNIEDAALKATLENQQMPRRSPA
jgi:hypothetical protein